MLNIVAAVLATSLVGVAALWIGANLSTAEKRLLYRPKRLYASGDPDFRRALGILLGPPLGSCNRITTLINGDRIFPPMLAAIRAARTSVTFETFVFRDQIGCDFCEALSAAAQRGVTVCILLDWMGSRGMDANLLEATRKAGCDLQLYHPPTWFHLGRLNNRTHRKVMIVDGAIGFTGGVGMGNEWLGDALDQGHRSGAARSAVLPCHVCERRRHGCTDVRQFPGGRLGEHAPDDLACSHGGAEIDRHRECVLRTGPAHHRRVGGSCPSRRPRSDRRPRKIHRRTRRALGGTRPLRRSAERRRGDL